MAVVPIISASATTSVSADYQGFDGCIFHASNDQKERDRLKVISDVDTGFLRERKAAELLGLRVRQMRRIQRRYRVGG